ncbi:CRC domain-containing protein TSO1-like isoform X2 [Salvia splendens]|uniref:CRC domain-containing protein TSO1-like isoform X2 n=1 Tax=Salvia splendens TaxID=180675 RepID=UPI001C25EC64|nr:CRC domain-containing protein TSO1-like isoform X2 [Salvia splendens]
MKMDSPESSLPASTSNACDTATFQDSPVFSYICNLSPIQPVKASSVTQGFPGLNSPPLVFTSPQLIPHKRAQFPRASFPKLHELLEESKNNGSTVKGNGEQDIQLSTSVVASTEKASDSSNSVDELIQSPSGSREQFLKDIVNVDSPDPDFSFDSTIKKTEHNDQLANAPTCSKDIVVNLRHELNSGINGELAVTHPSICKETEDAQTEHILINASASEKDEVSVNCSTVGTELPADSVNRGEDNFTTESQNAKAGQAAPLDQSSHLPTGSKAFQNRGVRRRCLLFENAQHSIISSREAQDTSDGERPKTQILETPLTPIDGKLYPQNTLNSSIKLPKPSGFGLHLNSILNTVRAGSAATINVKAAQWDCLSATTDGNKLETHDCASDGSSLPLATNGVKPANDLVTFNSNANQSILGNKRETTEKDSELKGINDLSPKKKRMNATESGDGRKRCNCKRSKCLKLYCDCFAAGTYCADACSCQECFNRPNYEEKVMVTKQKIESRDPFAFAPRVVQHIIEQSPNISCGEDRSNFTPASARHKKGCKCKKSMCLKKYCECYQANVGCSDGCRCEGCKNVFGQKGEYGMAKVYLAGEDSQETTDDLFVQKCEIDASGSHTSHTDFANPNNLTPLTPAFQFSNHGTDGSVACFPSGKYFQSPESGLSYATPYTMSSASHNISANNAVIPESSKESRHGNGKTVDEFSAACSRSSLVWRGSPITPMAEFSGSKVLQEDEFEFGLSNTVQDDTPEILKDSPTPLNTVKANSPNKKRVSPPHGRPHEYTSSLSVDLRTARKFVLKAVPSFPPLTPCIDSKTLGVQQDSSPENRSANK